MARQLRAASGLGLTLAPGRSVRDDQGRPFCLEMFFRSESDANCCPNEIDVDVGRPLLFGFLPRAGYQMHGFQDLERP